MQFDKLRNIYYNILMFAVCVRRCCNLMAKIAMRGSTSEVGLVIASELIAKWKLNLAGLAKYATKLQYIP
jgi:hypothetical protein